MGKGFLVSAGVSFRAGWAVADLRAVFDSKFAQAELSTNTTSLSIPHHYNLLGIKLEKGRVRRNSCSPSQGGKHNTWRDDVADM